LKNKFNKHKIGNSKEKQAQLAFGMKIQ